VIRASFGFARRPLAAAVLALVAVPAFPQAPPPSPAPIDLRYTGATWRAGVGYDTEDYLRGDLAWVFREDAASAWIADGWITREESGGAKLSYHWRPEGAGADTGVRKLFGAFDQNRWRDRKVTIGGGFERERYTAALYATAGISGRRNIGTETSATVETTRSADAIGVYEQDVTTTTTKRTFERPYDWGVGGRVGHFYDAHLVRVDAGLDYEAGRGSSSQATLTLGVEKYFAGSPWSIAVQGEAYRKSGSEEPKRDDQRLWVMLRYEFGGPAWRPARSYRDIRVETPAPLPPPVPAAVPVAAAPVAAVAPPPRIEKRIVKSTASASADAFFELDRAALKPEARAALDATIVQLKRAPIEGNLRVVGHTCDLGSDAYNLALSRRRAAVVRDYLVQAGFAADRIVVEGMGERAPRFANDAAGRPRNRRVDIEFVTLVERVEEVAVPAAPMPAPAVAAPVVAAVPPPSAPPPPIVEWRREEIATEPAWVRRALRQPAKHKTTVDVYRTATTSTESTTGPRRYLNFPPQAVADAYTVQRDAAAAVLAVIANDSDPDGDTLIVVSATPAAHGTVTVNGGTLSYQPAPGYVGPDTFSYTIRDPAGLTSTAAVNVTVVAAPPANQPPIAVNDFAQAGYNQPVTIDVLANDSDPDGDALVIESWTQPPNGTVTQGPGRTLVYRSKPDYIGYELFTYTIVDGRGGRATASVRVFADP